METIYVVTSGSYSDYSIEGIFTTRELAQEFIDVFAKSSGYFGYNDIEEYPLNPHMTQIRAGLKPYFLRMKKDGTAYDIRLAGDTYGFDDDSFGTGFDSDGDYYAHLFAKDEQHAIKICNERRVQLIESDKWPNK